MPASREDSVTLSFWALMVSNTCDAFSRRRLPETRAVATEAPSLPTTSAMVSTAAPICWELRFEADIDPKSSLWTEPRSVVMSRTSVKDFLSMSQKSLTSPAMEEISSTEQMLIRLVRSLSVEVTMSRHSMTCLKSFEVLLDQMKTITETMMLKTRVKGRKARADRDRSCMVAAPSRPRSSGPRKIMTVKP